jgi:hypothetical protein
MGLEMGQGSRWCQEHMQIWTMAALPIMNVARRLAVYLSVCNTLVPTRVSNYTSKSWVLRYDVCRPDTPLVESVRRRSGSHGHNLHLFQLVE